MLQKLMLRAESEQELCGSLILSSDKIDEVAGIINSKHFLSERFRHLYEVMLQLRKDGKATSPDLIWMNCDQTILEIDDLVKAMESVHNSAWTVEHAQHVKRAYRCREFARLISEQVDSLESGIVRVDEMIDGVASGIETIINDEIATPARTFREIVSELSTRQSFPGITTGINGLDAKLTGDGWQPGQLVVLGARPSVGKTAMMTGFALAASLNRVGATYFSFEMGDTEIADRIIRQHGLHLNDELDCERASELDIDLRDCGGWTIEKLEAAIRQAHRKEHRTLFIIDYIGLIASSNKKRDRWQEIGDMTRTLKCLARALKVTIVAAQQFNRAVDARASRTPLMSDFRESGNIEQDADILLGLERETREIDGMAPPTEAKLHIMKQRNGATGEVLLEYIPGRTLFRDREAASFDGDGSWST